MLLLEELKPSLKDKWLDYYQANQVWIYPLMNEYKHYTGTPESGRRPRSEMIIGAIAALDPKLSELLNYFFIVSNNYERIIEVLGLHFDPEKELEKRELERAKINTVQLTNSSIDPEVEYLNKIREENK